ncbi:MAG: hypothetical protein HYW78_02205 [Parcubacteria group bacterium]|nr:hypothetical protein [Parcubacteria group bacterium]
MNTFTFDFKKIAIIISFLLFISLPLFVFAQPELNSGLGAFANETNLGNADLPSVIGRVVKLVISFLGLIAVLIILGAGFMWMTSGGNEEKVKKAKKLMIAGVVGLIIVILSYSIASFVLSRFTGIAN